MKLKTKNLILYSLFAAMTAVLSQISLILPFTPVPVNLAMLSVFMSGAMVGSKGGAVSQIVYVILGAIGIPVFAKLSAGVGIILGPTGGYIIGYIASAYITGYIIEKTGKGFISYIFAMAIGLIACYLLGTIWFMIITGTMIYKALTLCVIPFIPGDMLKILAGSFLASRLNPIINKNK